MNLAVKWQQGAPLPLQANLPQTLQDLANIYSTTTVVDTGGVDTALAGATTSLQATYFTPFHMHAATGPSCGVADVRTAPDPATGIQATIWSGTQGVYPLQGAIAGLLKLSAAAVHVTYVEASGCYGHNGADDAAADAALLSQAVGQPVRVQWMRQDEHGWEPLGPAMLHQMTGGLDSQGTIAAWDHTMWTPTHGTRPGSMVGNLLAGQETGSLPPAPGSVVGSGTRNAPVNYAFARNRLTVKAVSHFTTPNGNGVLNNILLRPSSLRSLGGLSNTFANESFMDELAAAAGVDPLDFRLQYLSDPRAVAVLQAMATQARWHKKPKPSKPVPGQTALLNGRGLTYLQYENNLAYVATYAEVQVDPTTGVVQVTRVVVAHDCGLIINPAGLQNQIEGNVIQATSRTLKEEVQFDGNGVTSTNWLTYPILNFNEVPSIEIVLIDQPTQPAWGAGEPVTETMASAIGNAIFDATGVRLRTLPFTPARVLAALS